MLGKVWPPDIPGLLHHSYPIYACPSTNHLLSVPAPDHEATFSSVCFYILAGPATVVTQLVAGRTRIPQAQPLSLERRGSAAGDV